MNDKEGLLRPRGPRCRGDDGDELPGRQAYRGIIQAIIRVHTGLGPGLLESVYEKALVDELLKRGFKVETEKVVPILYEGEEIGIYRLDIVVEGTVIVEVKTVEALGRIHYAQLRSYLRATGLNRGILVNFDTERADYRRVTPND